MLGLEHREDGLPESATLPTMPRSQPYRPDIPPHGVPIADGIGDTYHVTTLLCRCGHSVEVTDAMLQALVERFGASTGCHHPKVARALVCQSCGATGPQWQTVARATAGMRGRWPG